MELKPKNWSEEELRESQRLLGSGRVWLLLLQFFFPAWFTYLAIALGKPLYFWAAGFLWLLFLGDTFRRRQVWGYKAAQTTFEVTDTGIVTRVRVNDRDILTERFGWEEIRQIEELDHSIKLYASDGQVEIPDSSMPSRAEFIKLVNRKRSEAKVPLLGA